MSTELALPTRIGFIGSGFIARNHVAFLATVPDAEIGAVTDLDPARAEGFAHDHGGTVVDSVDAVIEDSDAVYVCTWTSAHADIVDQVAAAGLPVFCEKPLATDLATAEAMVSTVEAAGIVNQCGLVLRRSPAFRWVQHLISDPAAGAVQNLVFRDDQFLPIQGNYASTWRADVDRAGAGALLEHSVHDLDLIDWLVGPLERITAEVSYHHEIAGIEDAASCLMRGPNGAQAVLTSTWHDVLGRPSQRRVEVLCRNRVVTLEGDWLGPVSWEDADGTRGRLEGDDLVKALREVSDLRTNPARAFVHSVRTGTPAYPDFRVALRAQRLVAAAYDSAADGGRPVALAAPAD
ncbi:MAG: Gfo/Idh/MocA family protein [Acidimicrobiales bacterium]